MKNQKIILSINDPLYSSKRTTTPPCVVSFFASPHRKDQDNAIFAVSVRHAFHSNGGSVFSLVGDEKRYVGEVDDGFVSAALLKFKESALLESVSDIGLIRLDNAIDFKNEFSGIHCTEFVSGSDIILSEDNDIWIGKSHIGRVEEVLLDVDIEFSDGSCAEMEVFRVVNDFSSSMKSRNIPAGSLAIDRDGRAAGILVGSSEKDLFFVDAQAVARYLGIELAKPKSILPTRMPQ